MISSLSKQSILLKRTFSSTSCTHFMKYHPQTIIILKNKMSNIDNNNNISNKKTNEVSFFNGNKRGIQTFAGKIPGPESQSKARPAPQEQIELLRGKFGENKDQLPYGIERTEMGALPVYVKTSNGGTKLTTKIKGIKGDITKLAHHLQLLAPNEDIKVKHHLWQIEMKGDRLEQLRDFFTSKGF